MKRTILAALLMAAAGLAQAQLSFTSSGSVQRTESFDSVAGVPTYGTNTWVTLGSLSTSQTGTITFTYLGQESGYNNVFHLNINNSHLYETNPVGTRVSSAVNTLGAVNFSFEGDVGRYAVNGGAWTTGTSIGLIATNYTVSTGGGAGTYAYILGYNDSAGASTLGDWDDFVVGVNFVATPVPEPETYAMMLAGLGLLGFAGRRRKQKQAAA